MEYHVYWLLKSSYFELSGDGKYGLLCAKTVMERWYLLITVLESSSFELFRDGKYGLFLSLKVDWKMILLINKSSCFEPWKVLVLKFWEMGNMAFLWTKKAMERWYLLGPFELSKIFQELRNIVFRTLLQLHLEILVICKQMGSLWILHWAQYWMKYRWFSLKCLSLSYLYQNLVSGSNMSMTPLFS